MKSTKGEQELCDKRSVTGTEWRKETQLDGN